ncbi:MAG: MBL fold metallo-hydrolase [Bacteroidaceae bacterium]|nr:MBL fold metallo-hydrolase [Bacteroidaceae bacterium]
MIIKVHRGLEQVGGCITEISTATTRVFIDMGQNLPGVGEPTTEEQDAKMVNDIFALDAHKQTAVFYTHAHGDHVGLFQHVPADIPQYISAGGKEILLAKYETLKKGHEGRKEQGLINSISQMLKGWLVTQQAVVRKDEDLISRIKSFRTWERPKPHATPPTLTVGDIRVTPFFNCHSMYDSHMFLIEADGKRIWHTGDYREHGYLGKGLFPTLRRYATDIDVLITEGTMLNRTDGCIHESEVGRRMASVMNAFKYVIVLASSTDIERLATIKEASKTTHKPLYICNGLMKRTMLIFTRREGKVSKGLFEFHPHYISKKNVNKDSMKKKGLVLISGASNLAFIQELCKDFNPSDVLLIYSSWDGYYKDPAQVALNPRYKSFREAFTNVIDIHTPGHADRKTIEKVIEVVKPKEVICIHKGPGAEL